MERRSEDSNPKPSALRREKEEREEEREGVKERSRGQISWVWSPRPRVKWRLVKRFVLKASLNVLSCEASSISVE